MMVDLIDDKSKNMSSVFGREVIKSMMAHSSRMGFRLWMRVEHRRRIQTRASGRCVVTPRGGDRF